MFQHRHYIAIAGVLAEARKNAPKLASATDVLDHIESLFVSRLLADNFNFDSDRFRAAARGEPSNGRDRT